MKYNFKLPNKVKVGGAANAPGANAPSANAPGANAPLGANAPGANAPVNAPLNAPVNAPLNAPLNAPVGANANTGGLNTSPKANNKANNKANKVNNVNANNSQLANKVGKGISNAINTAGDMAGSLVGKVDNVIAGSKAQAGKVYAVTAKFDTEWVTKILLVLIIGAVFLGFMILFKEIAVWYNNKRQGESVILPGTKDANHELRIPHDSKEENIHILRSENQEGIEFTYSFWMLIVELENTVNEKHVFHKGGENQHVNMAPAVFIKKNTNSLKVYMNTFKKIDESVEVPDIPIKKWVNVQIVLQRSQSTDSVDDNLITADKDHVLNVYINGQNKKSKLLKGVPRQNNGDIYLNKGGGFKGYISKMKYFPSALNYEKIKANVKEGPSKIKTVDTGDLPPYLNDNWWFQE